jgi:uncharacterized metal-binding protein
MKRILKNIILKNRNATLRGTCSTGASLPQNCAGLASPKQPSRRFARDLLHPSNLPAELRRTCATRANVPQICGGLAQPAQTSRRFAADLRNSRQRPAELRRTCGTCANAPTIGFMVFTKKGYIKIFTNNLK